MLPAGDDMSIREIRQASGFLLVVSTCALQAAGPIAKASAQSLVPRWERSFATEDRLLRYRGSLDLNSREMVFAAMSYARGTDRVTPRLWLWRVEKDSGEADRLPVQMPATTKETSQAQFEVYDLEAFSVVHGGAIVAILEALPRGHWLVTLDSGGRVLSAGEIRVTDTDMAFTQILADKRGGFFAAGVSRSKAYLARLRDSGEIIWERHGGDAAEVSLASTGGALILAVNRVSTLGHTSVPAEIGIELYDVDGTQKATTKLSGRRGRLSPSGSHVGLVYDIGLADALDIRLTEFDPTLQPLRTSQIVSSEQGFAGFRIVPAGDGGYVVAGAKELKPFAKKIRSSGQAAWSFWGEGQPIGVDVDVVASAQGVFLLYPRLDKTGTTIRVVALKE